MTLNCTGRIPHCTWDLVSWGKWSAPGKMKWKLFGRCDMSPLNHHSLDLSSVFVTIRAVFFFFSRHSTVLVIATAKELRGEISRKSLRRTRFVSSSWCVCCWHLAGFSMVFRFFLSFQRLTGEKAEKQSRAKKHEKIYRNRFGKFKSP